jgi:Mn-dependent DtxR family transcriptional regulator
MKAATRERWRRCQRLLDEGVYETRADLAREMGVSRAAVTQGLKKLNNS